MTDAFSFVLNGRPVHVRGESTHTTLLQWLRGTGRTGTKEGCAEGDCGACTVILVDRAHGGRPTYRAINACIAFLPAFAGREVLTVEGFGGPPDPLHEAVHAPTTTPREGPPLHPVQAAMERHYGSQCGYCTPGFVASMFEGYHRDDLGEGPERLTRIVDQLNGNLCRCTGYRPIRDAMLDALAQKETAPPDRHRLKLLEPAPATKAVAYRVGEERFERPVTISELLRLKAAHPEAQLLGGATELGVFVNKRNAKYSFLLATDGVAELGVVTEDAAGWRVGGAVTLTMLEEAIGDRLPILQKMLWAFASRPIRSRATVAGNLVNASPIGDLAPVLLALDAAVELTSAARGTRSVELSDFFTGYRKSVLEADEIMTTIVIPKLPSAPRRLADSYKVSKRRELDISIAAAAFVVDLDEGGMVTRARLAYGGVAATPVRATSVEATLVGRPWNEATVNAAAAQLRAAFTPLSDVRSGKEFRSEVSATLLLKLFAGERSEGQDLPLSFLEVQGFTPNCEVHEDPSRHGPHESGALHVSGRAEYVYDEALRKPMLEMWPVLAPCARGTLDAVDLEEARAMPGVVTILTAADVPGEKHIGPIRHDEPLFAEAEILYHQQIVAMVVGTSWKACRDAAERVKVSVTEAPPLLGCEAALAAQSFHTGGHTIKRGDAAAAIAGAPHRLSGSLHVGGQEHFYLESQAAWAEVDDFGDLFVSSSTQHPAEVQALLAHVLDVPRSRVTVQSPRMGGAFGGKETQAAAWAVYAALGAYRTGRPVRVQLDRDLDLGLTGKRHPFYGMYECGFDDDGALLGLDVQLYSDGGYSLDLSESINDRALFHLDNSYYVPNVHYFGRVLKTNVVSHTAFRGFGGPQGMLVIEEVLDRVARQLGKKPEEVRARNLYRGRGETNTTHYGQEVGDERIPLIWDSLLRGSDFSARRERLAAWNREHRGLKRGLAITPVKFGISFTASFLNQAGALVHLYRDGSCQVNHGGTEMGQGLYTKMLGVAMRELGVTAAKTRVTKTRTDKVPNTSATAASSGSDLNGQAVMAACEAIRERLVPVAIRHLTDKYGARPSAVRFENDKVYSATDSSHALSLGEICERAYIEQVQMSAVGFYKTPSIAYDRFQGRGTPFYYFASGAAVAEVEVDGYSGMKRVRRVDILHDVGDSLHPSVDRGQIEGAFVQGMGWLTGEELKWDDRGCLLSHSASTYAIPALGDAPEEFRVELLRGATQPGVIHGSKAVGEPPLMLAISVREAIRDAIAQFGEPGGEVPLPCPATHEAIHACVRARTNRAR